MVLQELLEPYIIETKNYYKDRQGNEKENSIFNSYVWIHPNCKLKSPEIQITGGPQKEEEKKIDRPPEVKKREHKFLMKEREAISISSESVKL